MFSYNCKYNKITAVLFSQFYTNNKPYSSHNLSQFKNLENISLTYPSLMLFCFFAPFFFSLCYFTARLLRNLNDSFPRAIFFSLHSCRNYSQTCPMICWKTAETPPWSWNTPPAAIKRPATGNTCMLLLLFGFRMNTRYKNNKRKARHGKETHNAIPLCSAMCRVSWYLSDQFLLSLFGRIIRILSR